MILKGPHIAQVAEFVYPMNTFGLPSDSNWYSLLRSRPQLLGRLMLIAAIGALPWPVLCLRTRKSCVCITLSSELKSTDHSSANGRAQSCWVPLTSPWCVTAPARSRHQRTCCSSLRSARVQGYQTSYIYYTSAYLRLLSQRH